MFGPKRRSSFEGGVWGDVKTVGVPVGSGIHDKWVDVCVVYVGFSVDGVGVGTISFFLALLFRGVTDVIGGRVGRGGVRVVGSNSRTLCNTGTRKQMYIVCPQLNKDLVKKIPR